MIRRILLAMALLLVVAGAVAPAGQFAAPTHAAPAATTAQAPAAFLDKTRVIAHLAIAYGVFHHWVYYPYRTGRLSIYHPLKVAKAGLALLFAVHELKAAYKITSHSSSPTLKALNRVLLGLTGQFTSVGNLFHQHPSSLTNGQVASSINGLNNGVNASNHILNAPDAPISQLGNYS